jgi:hypothetical protein
LLEEEHGIGFAPTVNDAGEPVVLLLSLTDSGDEVSYRFMGEFDVTQLRELRDMMDLVIWDLESNQG